MPRPSSALLLDDEPHVRVFLRLLLGELGVVPILEAGSGQEGLDFVDLHVPQLTLLDLNLPVVNGLAVPKQLNARRPELPVIVVSSRNTTNAVMDCKKSGASGYLLKHSPRAALLEGLRAAIDDLDAAGEVDSVGG